MFTQTETPAKASSELPKIAIVVPVYNVQQYIGECLNSIQAQTYTNWECFVVDDGSKDQSGPIIDSYPEKDPRFHIIHQENKGLSGARNTALEQINKRNSDFSFVGFVDGDDRIEPNMYELMVQALKKDHSQLAVCGFYKFFGQERKIRGHIGEPQKLSSEDFLELVFSLKKWGNLCGAGGMVWKHLYQWSSIHQIRFPEDRDILEDEIFDVLAAQNIQSVSYVPQPLYGYRVRPASLVRNTDLSLRMLSCRELCLKAAEASPTAYLAVVAAYTQAYLSYFKNSKNPNRSLPFPVTNAKVQESFAKGFMSKKIFSTFQILRKSPFLFHSYLILRNLFHALSLKRLKKVNQ